MARIFEAVTSSERIKLGKYTSEDQPFNTIVLNASKNPISDAQGFHVAPIRCIPASNVLMYNPETKEIVDAGRTDVLSLDGETIITGNLTVLGQTTYSTMEHVHLTDRILEIGKNNAPLGAPLGIIMHDASLVYADGAMTVNTPLVVEGTVRALHFLGDGGSLSNITLKSITSQGSETSSNITAATIFADAFVGDGSQLSNVSLHTVMLQGNETDIPLKLTHKVTSLTTGGNIIIGRNASVAGRVIASGGFFGDAGFLSNITYRQIGHTFSDTMFFDQAPRGDGGLWTNVYLGRNFFDDTMYFKNGMVGDGSALSNITLEQVVRYGNTVQDPVRFNTLEANTFLGDGGLLSNVVLQDIINRQHDSITYLGDGHLLSNIDLRTVVAKGNTVSETVHFTDVCATRFLGDGGHLSNLSLACIVSKGNTVSETVHFQDVEAVRFMGDGGLLSNLSLACIVSKGNTVAETVHFQDVEAVRFLGDGGLLSNLSLACVVSKGNTVSETIHFSNVCAERFNGDGGFLSNLNLENITHQGWTTSKRVVFENGLLGDGGLLSNVTLQRVCDQSNRVSEIHADTYLGDGGLLSNVTLEQVSLAGNTVSGDIVVQGKYFGDGGLLSNITLARVCDIHNEVDRNVVFNTFTTKGHVGFGTNTPTSRVSIRNTADLCGYGEVDAIKITGSILENEIDLCQINAFTKANNGTVGGFGGGLVIKTKNPNGYLTPKMVIDAHGNMGIGTLVPQHKLDVIGNVRARRIWGDHTIIVTCTDGCIYGDMENLHYATCACVHLTCDITDIRIQHMPHGAALHIPTYQNECMVMMIVYNIEGVIYHENRPLKKSVLI